MSSNEGFIINIVIEEEEWENRRQKKRGMLGRKWLVVERRHPNTLIHKVHPRIRVPGPLVVAHPNELFRRGLLADVVVVVRVGVGVAGVVEWAHPRVWVFRSLALKFVFNNFWLLLSLHFAKNTGFLCCRACLLHVRLDGIRAIWPVGLKGWILKKRAT